MLRRVETVGATQGLPFLRRLSAKARVLLPRTQEIKLAARRLCLPKNPYALKALHLREAP